MKKGLDPALTFENVNMLALAGVQYIEYRFFDNDEDKFKIASRFAQKLVRG